MGTKIKLAIELCGQIRDWDRAHQHLVEFQEYALFRNIEIHYFLATWNRSGVKLDYTNSGPEVDIDVSLFKDYSIDEQPNAGPAILIPERWARANRLRNDYEEKHNIIYDAVVLTRPDIVFEINFLNEVEQKVLNLDKNIKNSASNTFNLGTVYTSVGSVVNSVGGTLKDLKLKANDFNFDFFSDDRLLIGHPVVINTFGNVINEVRIGSLRTSVAHYVITSHCMMMSIINLPFFGPGVKRGFKLNRESDYPLFFKKDITSKPEANVGELIKENLTKEDKKRLEEIQKKRKKNLI